MRTTRYGIGLLAVGTMLCSCSDSDSDSPISDASPGDVLKTTDQAIYEDGPKNDGSKNDGSIPITPCTVTAGGMGSDSGRGIGVDSAGNIYITGSFAGTAKFGANELTSSNFATYVAKLDPHCQFIWAVPATGTSIVEAYDIAVDGAGNSYITGHFFNTAHFGPHTLEAAGDTDQADVFVARLDPDGNFIWAARGGGPLLDLAESIAIDSSGNSYITGHFKGDAAPYGTTELGSAGDRDVFVAQVDPSGVFTWAVSAGGPDEDVAFGITVDENGNSYITGRFTEQADFGVFHRDAIGYWDIFVAKVSSNGIFTWAVSTGGKGGDHGTGIAVDGAGNLYLTGAFKEGPVVFGADTLSSAGQTDIFVAKMDSSGVFLWATSAGGISGDYGLDIALDSEGNSLVTGSFGASAKFGATELTSAGSGDFFAAKVDQNGNFVWAKPGGGKSIDSSVSIAVDGLSNSYITGNFKEKMTVGSKIVSAMGVDDIHMIKLDADGNME